MSIANFGRSISIDKCKAGMKVMAELRAKNGAILLSSGTVLTEEILNKLKKYNIKNIVVFEDKFDNEDDINSFISKEEKLIDEDIKEETLTKYRPKADTESNRLYMESIDKINQIINAIEEGEDLNFKKVKEATMPLFNEIINKNTILFCLESIKRENNSLYSHSVNTAILSGLLGKWLGLKRETIYNLILGGLLHDVGLYKIPNALFKKGSLTDKEIKAYKGHPLLTYEMMLKIKEIDITVKKMVLAHHEYCDGTGFPFGIKSEHISLECKILSVADTFDEIFMNNIENNKDMFFALKKLYEEYFTKLDFRCLDTFTMHMLWNHIGRYVCLSDNRIGEIVFINQYSKFKPIIKIESEIIDLSINNQLIIKNII